MPVDDPQQGTAVILPVLVLASITSIMSTDLYAPSLAHLPDYFGSTAAAAKLTMSLNVLAFGLAQLIHGPLADRFGRRPVMLVGMVAFALTSVACALAQSMEQLIVARIAQGIAASVEAVIVLTMIYDLFDETSRVRALSIFGMAIALAPAVAPVIGGWVYVLSGWRANFFIIAVMAAFTGLLTLKYLPESMPGKGHSLHLGRVAGNYARLFGDRRFMSYALISATSLAMIFAFITAGPFVLIKGFSVPTEHYGLYQGTTAVAFFVGSMMANRLADTVPTGSLLRLGLVCQAAGVLLLGALVFVGGLTALSLTAAMSLAIFGMGPVFAVCPARALEAAPGPAGAASALHGALEMALSGLAAAAVAVMHNETAGPLAYTLLALLVLSAVCYRLARLPEAGLEAGRGGAG